MFEISNLSVLAYANGFTLWHYKTQGALAPLQAPGFFDDAADMLSSGDMMLVSSPEGGRMLCAAIADGQVGMAPFG